MNLKKFFNIGKDKLYPIHRSITGSGILKSLKIIQKEFPQLKIIKIPSKKKIYDWSTPLEWNITEAYVIDMHGKKIIDFKVNNLHIINYSQPVEGFFKKNFLIKRLHSLTSQKNAIPYITSYYKKYWGFCVTENFKKNFNKKYKNDDTFKVVIKSKFKKGFLRYGELKLNGKSKEEIIVSTYICHPKMANNELSGPIVSMALINEMKKKRLEKSIRFLFVPETVGSIAFIYKNLTKIKNKIIGGFNLSCIGDNRGHSFMTTKYDNAPSDNSIKEAYKKLKIKYKKYSFLQRGSDERQYNSPGVDFKIASIFRSKYLMYKEYHTSLDDFKLVTYSGIKGGYIVAKTALEIFLKKIIPKNTIICEPFLSKRNLRTINNNKFYAKMHKKIVKTGIVDFLQYADGSNDLENISKYIRLNLKDTKKIYNILKKKKLVI